MSSFFQRQSSASNPCLVSNPCQNNATCFYSQQSGILTCSCKEGFSGDYCEVDPCDRAQCPENSECMRGGEGCRCLPGYKSKYYMGFLSQTPIWIEPWWCNICPHFCNYLYKILTRPVVIMIRLDPIQNAVYALKAPPFNLTTFMNTYSSYCSL